MSLQLFPLHTSHQNLIQCFLVFFNPPACLVSILTFRCAVTDATLLSELSDYTRGE